MIRSKDFDYPSILDVIDPCLVNGRTESHSFLVWYLQHYFRLDDTDALDAVCDGPDDKGIDAIYVDENLDSIVVFQCKLIQNAKKTLGDKLLKEFVGTLAQFQTSSSISEIITTTSNSELAHLMKDKEVDKKITNGYSVRGIFVTNTRIDKNGIEYAHKQDNLSVVDKSELVATYVPVDKARSVSTPASFDISGYDSGTYQVGGTRVVIAPLKGADLIQLDGIVSQALFASNVRGSLGRTKVNKDIGASIDDASEHQNFLLYHNGLTILCEKINKAADTIVISDYSVVNGCQSLTSLYDHRRKVTEDLRIMVRLIELPPGSDLADRITHHSNNQNSINARDLQSNSTIQRRLQSEFRTRYDGEVFYRIKRGELTGLATSVIENDEAGRLLLAFDLKQPWSCHQTYKILDELHAAIFARPEVNADRVFAVTLILEVILDALGGVQDQLMGSYRLTRYLLLLLVREALSLDGDGKRFCQNPSDFLAQPRGEERIRACCRRVVDDLVIDFNAEIRERQDAGKPLDYKRELKSPTAVRSLSRSIIAQYQKSILRSRVSSFQQEWQESGD